VSIGLWLAMLLDVPLDATDMPIPKATKSPKPCALVDASSL